MKNKFLSKAVPRGTRTIWRYLGALFLLFTFAIGQMWGQTTWVKLDSIDFTNTTDFPAQTITGANSAVTTATINGVFFRAKAKKSIKINNTTAGVDFDGQNGDASSHHFGIPVTGVNGSIKVIIYHDYNTTSANFKMGISHATDNDPSGTQTWDLSVGNTGATKNANDWVMTKSGLTGSEYIVWALEAGSSYKVIKKIAIYTEAPTGYSVTYVENGHGANQTDLTGKTALPNPLPTLSESGWIFGGWFTDNGTFENAAVAGASLSANATLYAKWTEDPSVTKYSVTYALNGPSGDAPTQEDVAEGASFNLAAAPSWAGHAFDGWLCSADAAVKAAGSSYTMTAANTTFTAQWHEVDCKIYSFTGGIGSAEKTADNAAVNATTLVMSNTAGRIKLTPATGEKFKNGDKIIISGTVGDTSKPFGLIVYAADGSTKAAEFSVAGNSVLSTEATLSLAADADYIYIARKGGTTTTLYTCEVHRSCAEGSAAGLSYAVAAVDKTEGDAAFTNALTNANGLVVAGYSSSNTAVATVASNGQVTIVAPGSATITAHSAVQTKAGTLYAAGSASYTLTVAACTPPRTPEFATTDPVVVTKNSATATWDVNGADASVAKYQVSVVKKSDASVVLDWTDCVYANPCTYEATGLEPETEYTFKLRSVGAAGYCALSDVVTEDFTTSADLADKYTVIFKDGDVTLDTKQFDVASNPSDAGIEKTKPLYTFAAWQKEGVDIALDAEFWATVIKDATVTLSARWTALFALDVNFKEAATQALGVETALNTYHYASDAGDISFEEKGLKIKTNAARFYFNVAPGKVAEIKFGNVSGATYSVDGGAAETLTSSQLKATYSASAQSCVMTMTTAAYNIVEKVTIHDPYEVSFNPNGGDPVAAQYGHPSVTLPSASNGTKSLLGWFDAATGGNKIGDVGDSYTPTADIELFAQWEDVSTDARLASITFSSDAGTLSPTFDPEVVNYTYTMPYGTAAIPTITGATSVSDKAQAPIIGDAATAWGGTQTVQGVAQSDDKKTYTITMVKAPKDGVSIIKATINSTTKNTIGEVTGLYKKDASCGGLSSYKFNGKGAYIGIELVAGQTFNEGDIINIHTTSAAGQGTIALYDDHGNTVSSFHDYGVMGGMGDNKFALPASAEDKSIIYVCRTEANTWNGYVDYIEVTRAMNPLLTALQFNSTDVEVTSTTVAALLPQGTNLGTMTVTPTIYWNGAGTAEVTSNAGAWAWGANTYRVTDKDGDYTEYTITLTEDELKHTVSFNTHGGSTIDPVQVVDGQKLAAAPADPTKDDYIFQYWSEVEDGAEVDVTTVQINADKEFHAVWASDGAIKLLDGSTVNHTNFITAVTADETVEFKGNVVNYAKFSGTVSGVNGVKDLTRVIAYNATTNKTKIQISAHNNSTSGRSILVKGLVEGADAATDLATIALGNKEDKVSDWIEFDNAANRTIYIMVSSSAGDVYFTQVKVIESGETPMKQVGEAGYSLNLNKGRFFGPASTDLAFEGLSARLSGDYTALNSGYAKLNATSMSFTVASAMTLSVTTNNNKTYYVTEGAAGTDNETAKTGVSEFDLTAGTWYITAGAAEVQITNIAFALPKCQKPTISAQPESKQTFGPGNLTATVVATVSDGGTLKYQWYNAATDEEVEGATSATLTTTTEGTYYVIVTNTLADHSDNFIKSAEATLGYRVTNDATLSALSASEGTLDPTFDKDVEEYRVDLPEGTVDVPTLSATATMDGYATVNITDATAFVNYEATSTVVVTSEDATANKTYTVKFYVDHEITTLVDVTGNMSWDFSKANDGTAAGSDLCNDAIFANVAGIVNNNDFESDNLKVTANKFAGTKLQASMIKFHTTVDGMIRVVFSNTGNKTSDRYLTVNGRKTDKGSRNSTAVTYTGFVYAGDVELGVVEGDGNMLNFTSVEFVSTVAYPRTVNPNNIGTLCWTNDAVLGGATLYELVGKNEYNKLVFEEVVENRLEAGKPYIFVPENGNTAIKVYNTSDVSADGPINLHNGMLGTFIDLSSADGVTLWGNYVISNNKYIYVDSDNVTVRAYRAYITSLDDVAPANPEPNSNPNGAPRRRIVMGAQGEQVATGCENLNVSDKPVKMIIDGQLFILRGEKMYDAKGQLVK